MSHSRRMKRMRFFSLGSVAIALLWTANPLCYSVETEHADIKVEINRRHDEAVKRLRDWIAQVSIAAENRGYPEGAKYMAKLARDAGFQQATVINTDGKPGVFATLDAGAPKTVGFGIDPGAIGNLQKLRNRRVALAAQRRFISRLRLHR